MLGEVWGREVNAAVRHSLAEDADADKLQRLASEPRPPGTEKLFGQEKYRLRQGDYRVVYSVDDDESKVVIVKIGHRRDFYR